jgi:2',3'-cyclic-nucleotide 2'-phosphodiesterase (5'-nucleotidase family)
MSLAKLQQIFTLLLLAVSFTNCEVLKKVEALPTVLKKTEKVQDDGLIDVTILQLNDVYEIAPLSGGKVGGMARVATLRKQLIKENPNTLTIMAGDFFNPSVTGTLSYGGKKIRGAQMIDAMNTVGFDVAVFGNHEFDLDYPDFQARINESKFQYIGGNCKWQQGATITAFTKKINDTLQQVIPDTYTWNVKDADGTTAKIGFFSATVNSNPKPYVRYNDWMESVKSDMEKLIPVTDVVLTITHLNKAEDRQLAAMMPTLPLIMGGHDHESMIERIGITTLAKADANAKTAYVHRIQYNKLSKVTTIKSQLIDINDTIVSDSMTEAVVNKWVDITRNSLKAQGIEAERAVAQLKNPLDGRSESVRAQQNNMGEAIAKALLKAAKQPADAAFFNGGAIRIDDFVSNTVTQYDIVRVLPFGGGIVEVDMKGSLLQQILQAGLKNQGSGGYLQWANITYNEKNNAFLIQNQPLIADKMYHIVTTEFLMTGLEKGLSFLKPENPAIVKIDAPKKEDTTDIRNDIRLVVIDYMKSL